MHSEKKFRLQSNEDEGCFAEETAGNHSQENTGEIIVLCGIAVK